PNCTIDPAGAVRGDPACTREAPPMLHRYGLAAILITSPAVSLALVPCATSGSTSVRLGGRFACARGGARGHFAVEWPNGKAAESPIVKKADAQSTALLQHPIVFYLDAALVPKWEASLEALSARAIDTVAKKLASMKEREPAMFAWMAPNLRRIEWDYSATAK